MYVCICIYNFNLIICTSYHIYHLPSNNFSWNVTIAYYVVAQEYQHAFGR